MKRNLLLILALGLVARMWGQCPNDNTYFDTFNVPNTGSTASNSQVYVGEYVRVPVVDGGQYEFSVSGAQGFSPRISLYYDNGGSIAYSSSSISWTSDINGDVRLLLDNTNCTADSGYAALSVRCIRIPTPPSNDECSSAQTLYPNASCVPTWATTSGATESSISSSCHGDADDDVWFRFTAINTIARIELNGSGTFSPVMRVSPSCFGGNLYCGTGSSNLSATVTNLTIGQTYYIQVYAYGTGQRNAGDFSICVVSTPPPTNDDCALAYTLYPNTGARSSSTMGIMNISGTSCTGNPDDDVWFDFTANNPNMRIAVATTNMWPAFELFDGPNCGGASLDCNYSTGSASWNLSNLVVGRTYKLRIYDHRSGIENTGTFDISLHGWPQPANDEHTNAITVQHEPDTVPPLIVGNLQGATASAPVQNAFCGSTDPNKHDVWYKFVAKSEQVKVTFQSTYGTQLQLFSDSCSSHINCVAAGSTQVLYGLTEGETYYLRVVATWGGTYGDFFNFSLGYPGPPSYDDCQQSIELTQNNDRTTWHWASARGTTQSFFATPNCVGSADDDIWFSFVAQSSEVALEMISSGDYDGVLQVYERNGCGRYHLDCINDINGAGVESRILSNLTIGQRYKIRAYSHSSARPRSHFVGLHVLYPQALNVNLAENKPFQVWPNPSNGLFFFEAAPDAMAKIQIFDALGQLVHSTQTTDNQINIQHLPAGVYIARYSHNLQQYTTRLVKID